MRERERKNTYMVKRTKEIVAGFEEGLINARMEQIVTEGGQNAGEFLEGAQRRRYLKAKRSAPPGGHVLMTDVRFLEKAVKSLSNVCGVQRVVELISTLITALYQSYNIHDYITHTSIHVMDVLRNRTMYDIGTTSIALLWRICCHFYFYISPPKFGTTIIGARRG